MKAVIPLFIFFIASLLMSSCSVVEGIFNAGMSVGIFFTVLLISAILYVVFRIGNKRQ